MVYVIIPVFNRWIFTEACLISLRNQTYKEFKVIVVDHGSTDFTSENIKAFFPEVILIPGINSMWWTAATNLGIQTAMKLNATYVLTLNNDTIAKESYIEELLKVVDRVHKPCLIGSTAINKDDDITFAGEVENWFWETSTYNHIDLDKMKKDYVTCSRFPGRGLLIPIVVINEIGFFDEVVFPHYLADYDFTNRARREGYSIFCSTKAKLITYPEASVSHEVIKKKNFKNYISHLFGIKGGAQLVLFYKYAFRHCPKYALPSFLFLGTMRRLIGYWLK